LNTSKSICGIDIGSWRVCIVPLSQTQGAANASRPDAPQAQITPAPTSKADTDDDNPFGVDDFLQKYESEEAAPRQAPEI
jgi:hypothetical protein